MSRVRAINELNDRELASQGGDAGSWHAQYKDSPYIYVGSLAYDLSEGDTVTVFSQYGEVLEINLIRDKDTGKSKGFAFLRYADPRSAILAVDNLNGISILGRTIRVDHVLDYQKSQDKNSGSIRINEDIIAKMTEEISKTYVQEADLDLERIERQRRKQERRERETSEERKNRKLKSLEKKAFN